MILAWASPFNDHDIYVYVVYIYACHYNKEILTTVYSSLRIDRNRVLSPTWNA